MFSLLCQLWLLLPFPLFSSCFIRSSCRFLAGITVNFQLSQAAAASAFANHSFSTLLLHKTDDDVADDESFLRAVPLADSSAFQRSLERFGRDLSLSARSADLAKQEVSWSGKVMRCA